MKNLGITKKNIDFFNLQPIVDEAAKLGITKKWWVLVFIVCEQRPFDTTPKIIKACRFSNYALNKLRENLIGMGLICVKPLDFCLLF